MVPVSLLGNWNRELQSFVPEIPRNTVHFGTEFDLGAFLTITTYEMVCTKKVLTETSWDIVIVDEIQAIENPSSQQTKGSSRRTGGLSWP